MNRDDWEFEYTASNLAAADSGYVEDTIPYSI